MTPTPASAAEAVDHEAAKRFAQDVIGKARKPSLTVRNLSKAYLAALAREATGSELWQRMFKEAMDRAEAAEARATASEAQLTEAKAAANIIVNWKHVAGERLRLLNIAESKIEGLSDEVAQMSVDLKSANESEAEAERRLEASEETARGYETDIETLQASLAAMREALEELLAAYNHATRNGGLLVITGRFDRLVKASAEAYDVLSAGAQPGEDDAAHEPWCASLMTTRLTLQKYPCNCRPAREEK